ncbi:MAG: DMT family transporter [Caulobacter sp.]|jgi:transporter family-2 protein|nr:DMT family transporter [Caulobacter sp.]
MIRSIVIVAVLASILGGMMTATQGPTNALLARPMNSPVNAALVSFAVGTLVLLVAALALRVKPDLSGAANLPWYAWLGGAYGAVFVVAAAFSAPRLGVATTITLMVGGQLLMSVILDHFGAFGIEPRPVNLARLGGLGLVVLGVLMVRRG